VFTNTKIALAAAFVLGAASATLANDIDVNPSLAQSARQLAQYLGQKQKHENAFAYNTCPALEGYPDCHPDGRESWTTYSTAGESMAQKKGPTNGVRRERNLERGGTIPAPK
jgi:hypothetical protein